MHSFNFPKLILLILFLVLSGHAALAQCPKGFKKNTKVKVCTPDIDENDERAIKLTFEEGLNKYEAHAVSNALIDDLLYELSYEMKIKMEEHYPETDLDVRKNLNLNTTFHSTSVDLNGDGKDEVIVSWFNQYFCGSGGCYDYILDNSKGKWVVIGKRFGRSYFSFISKDRVNGYSTIHFTSRDGTPRECVFKDGEYVGEYCN